MSSCIRGGVDVNFLARGNIYSKCELQPFEKMLLAKSCLANDGNCREMRYFTSQTKLYEYLLPPMIHKLASQKYVGILELKDTRNAMKCCEAMSRYLPHIEYIPNGSGSLHNLRNLHKLVALIRVAPARCGGAYSYTNQQGCDVNRLYYDGCAMIMNNELCLAQSTGFGIHKVEVVSAVVDLSFGIQSYSASKIPIISVNVCLSIKIEYLLEGGEIALGVNYWLWDYLRRSGTTDIRTVCNELYAY